MSKMQLTASTRKVLGRKVKKLRAEGFIPANIFGKKVKSAAVTLNAKEFETIFKRAGETTLIDLLLGKESKAVLSPKGQGSSKTVLSPKGQGSSKTVLIRNVQVHPIDGSILHVDFQQVDLKAKVTAKIPVEVVGESPAEKQGLGTAVVQTNEIEVEALPTELPEKFEVDISHLVEVDQSISIKDIKFDKSKVEIKDDVEKIIVKVEPLRKEEEVIAPAPVEGEAPAEGAETPAEGEAESTKTETPQGKEDKDDKDKESK